MADKHAGYNKRMALMREQRRTSVMRRRKYFKFHDLLMGIQDGIAMIEKSLDSY